jgi:thiamine transport system ATP-binding protein
MAVMSEPGVDLHNVSVEFGSVTALDEVNLSVQAGEFFTLVGPSGCGKTTTLRAIAGFERPTHGTVAIDGRDVTGVSPENRGVGVVFQNYALFPHMTVRENVGYGLRFHEPPGGVTARERVDELLDFVDMSALAGRDPSQLSGGQQQRVALARALAPGPDVLLLDEPLSALDARLRERLRITVREIQQFLDITTVYVTHDQAEALAISDRVAVVNDGHIEQVGSPESIYRDPNSRFVAEFVGDNNVFDASVVATDPLCVSIDGERVELSGVMAPVGDRATLSLRPEDVFLVSERDTSDFATPKGGGTASGDASITVTVDNVEFLGDAYRLHCDWNGDRFLVKTDQDVTPGETVSLAFDASALHVV